MGFSSLGHRSILAHMYGVRRYGILLAMQAMLEHLALGALPPLALTRHRISYGASLFG